MQRKSNLNSNFSGAGCNPLGLGLQLHLVSITEAAHLLGRSVRTLRYWQAIGLMPERIQVGRKKLYRADQLPIAGRSGA